MVDRSGRRRAEQPNVLLVDDGSSIAAAHRTRLEGRGYHVINTSDVNASLTIARQTTLRAIFLTAARLGSERTPFLQALRREDETRHIPVTFLPIGHNDFLERLGLSRVGRELW